MTPIEIGGTVPAISTDWGIVEKLPVSAAVGDTCSFKVRETESSPWKLWHLRKVEESGERPWAKEGGPALRKQVENFETKSTSAISSTAALSMTAPLSMEALFEWGTEYSQQKTASGGSTDPVATGIMSLFLNTVSKRIAAVVTSFVLASAPHHGKEIGSLAKGQVAEAKFQVETGLSVAFIGPWLEIDPLRVG